MKRGIIVLSYLALTFSLSGQSGYDRQWVLDRFILMDFREESLQMSVLNDAIAYGSGDFCTSICNEEGGLLFYSGGCYLINRAHEIMENGNDINSEYAYMDFCYDGDFPIPHSNIALPLPEDEQKYLYFNLDLHIINGILPAPIHLYYQVIDMSLDGGLGAVTEKKQIAVTDTLARGYLQAVRNANGSDWWVIAPEWNSNCYYVLPVTSDGVGIAHKQCIGGTWSNLDGGGQLVFSPDRTKLARIESDNGWYLFDFDAETGLLSNPVLLMEQESENFFRGAAFSANSRYLYVSADVDLFQFDLESEAIPESIQLVGQLNPADAFPGVGSLSLQKLAPDDRIYISSPGAHRYLSVINRPNCPGTLCDFQPWSIELPVSNYAGLPNLPHFSIPDPDPGCDPISASQETAAPDHVSVFPNPASNVITIHASKLIEFQVFNMLGQVQTQGLLGNETSEIDVSNLEDGIYFIRIYNAVRKSSHMEKIIIQRK